MMLLLLRLKSINNNKGVKMIDDHGFKSSKSKLKYNYEFVWKKTQQV